MFCIDCKKHYQMGETTNRKISENESMTFCPKKHPMSYLKNCEKCSKITVLEESKRYKEYNHICKSCFKNLIFRDMEISESDFFFLENKQKLIGD